jgi:hypothetical protein
MVIPLGRDDVSGLLLALLHQNDGRAGGGGIGVIGIQTCITNLSLNDHEERNPLAHRRLINKVDGCVNHRAEEQDDDGTIDSRGSMSSIALVRRTAAQMVGSRPP